MNLIANFNNKIKIWKNSAIGPIKNVNEHDANETHKVVSMIGAEPFQQALEEGAEIVIAGRSSDAAIYAALPLMRVLTQDYPGIWVRRMWSSSYRTKGGARLCYWDNLQNHFTIEPGHRTDCTRTRVAAHII